MATLHSVIVGPKWMALGRSINIFFCFFANYHVKTYHLSCNSMKDEVKY